eukprot:1279165-Pyramimonas_sp.AAC.1
MGWGLFGQRGVILVMGASSSHRGAMAGPLGASWAFLGAMLEDIGQMRRRLQFALLPPKEANAWPPP